MRETKRIAVLGAGVVGLSTAVNIQQRLNNVDVTIIADKWMEDTTSYGAAGIFKPFLVTLPGVPLAVLRKWVHHSWTHLTSLQQSPQGQAAGVTFISGFHYVDNKLELPLFAECVRDFEILTQEECQSESNNVFSYGFKYSTILCEPRRYLPYLTNIFKEQNGGNIVHRKIQSLSELVGEYDVIVNCMGYGNKELLNDNKLVPVKGHLIKVEAPWVQKFLYTDSAYAIPGKDFVNVGGIWQYDIDDLNIKEQDEKKIWKGAVRVLPSLKRAKWLQQWVGLRPHREPLRLEAETIQLPNGSLKVVHNYGHGTCGITISWGTAINAVELVKQFLPVDYAKLQNDPPYNVSVPTALLSKL